jgi:hypothetical protein
MLKEIYQDSKIARKCIFKKAWKIAKMLKIAFAIALSIVWHEVKQIVNNPFYITLKLYINNKKILLSTTLQDSIYDIMEVVGEYLKNINKKLFYNISNRVYNKIEEYENMVAKSKAVTLHQDIYFVTV